MSGEASKAVHHILRAYDGTGDGNGTVAVGTWAQIEDALPDNAEAVEIYDSSGSTLELGVGPSSAEVGILYIPPTGNGRIPLTLNKGMRLAIRAVDAAATTGDFIINFYT